MLLLLILPLVSVVFGASYNPRQHAPGQSPFNIGYGNLLPQTTGISVENYASNGYINALPQLSAKNNVEVNPNPQILNTKLNKINLQSPVLNNNAYPRNLYINPQISGAQLNNTNFQPLNNNEYTKNVYINPTPTSVNLNNGGLQPSILNNNEYLKTDNINPQLSTAKLNFNDFQTSALNNRAYLNNAYVNPQIDYPGINANKMPIRGNPQITSPILSTELGNSGKLFGNRFVNQQNQPSDINFNGYINPQLQSSAINTNGFIPKTYVNPQLPPSAINNNGYVNPQFLPSPINNQGFGNRFDNRYGDMQLRIPGITPKSLGFQTQSNLQKRRFGNGALEVAFQWRYIDWVHPTVQLTGKNFTVGNPFSQDVDIDRRGRIFVTSPQWLPGTPITLSTITELTGQGGPLLTPYPDWTWHRSNCDSLVSVYRIAIDECDRLWMVDTGMVSGKPVCPSKIIVFDLNTDQLLLKYVIPIDQTAGGMASYVCPIVEVGDSCKDTYLYVADVGKHGLLVYSLIENKSWRLDNTPGNAFGLDQEAVNLTIAGETIELTDGTLGMSLSPRGFFNKRYLYFNSLASFYEKFADTDSLKRSFVYQPIIYQSARKRVSQAGAQATSRTGAIFFQLAEYTALACWNIERPFAPENVVVLAQDEEILQYVSGIKVVTNANGEEEVWFNTNRLQKIVNNTKKIEEVSYRFIKATVKDLIRGTKCEPTGFRTSDPTGYQTGELNLDGWQRI